MQTIRTPEERFAATAEAFPYPPRYVEVGDGDYAVAVAEAPA